MKIKDPISTLTHFIGMILSIIAIILLVSKANVEATFIHVISFTLFGISLIMLYFASTIYHFIEKPKKLSDILHRVDHMMIYVLIAGTYTPICLIPLNGLWGWSLLSIIWGVALAGITLKALWINAPRWLSTGIYILMGWLVIIAFNPLMKSLPSGAFAWLLAGGIVYTLGGLIYALKWPRLKFNNFGFHELFHLFVMGGSFSHFILMYKYILQMNV
ncbi:MAG: PAQR family membrane homeostasis protein TrhA [Eubacteriales bacterium]